MAEKKLPLRMCAGCSQMKPKKELIRVVKTNEGEISLDFTGRKNGRGAYMCRSLDCLKKARKTKRIDRTFKAVIPAEIYDSLEKDFSNEQ